MAREIPDAHGGTDPLLRVDDVAQFLRVSRRKAFQLLAELPVLRIGPRSRRVRRSDLEAWLKTRYEGS